MNAPSLRVLLVDDSQRFLAAARAFLAAQPQVHVVGVAESGMRAIEAITTLQPHLVLMDLEMPQMTGLEATRAIKQIDPTVSVVILSFHDEPWRREEAGAWGADGFVGKSAFVDRCPALLASFLPGPDVAAGCETEA